MGTVHTTIQTSISFMKHCCTMHSDKFPKLNEAESFKLVRIVDAFFDCHESKNMSQFDEGITSRSYLHVIYFLTRKFL